MALSLEKRTHLLVLGGILFALLFPTKIRAKESEKVLGNSIVIRGLAADSVVASRRQSKRPPLVGGVADLRLGFGHHDNLTRAKTWNGPSLKTSDTYIMLYSEFGPSYKRASTSLFISYTPPIPKNKKISRYVHMGEMVEYGLLVRMRLLSMESTVNFTPVVGHKLFREVGRIFDSEGQEPDSLKFGFSENGMFYGLESQFRLHKIDEGTDQRLTIGYVYDDLKIKANRFRIEWGIYGSLGEGPRGQTSFDEFLSFSIRLELVKWRDGRDSWYITGSFGVNAK